jgi:hypothetical protein
MKKRTLIGQFRRTLHTISLRQTKALPMQKSVSYLCLMTGILSLITLVSVQAQGIEKVACVDQSGRSVPCGGSWTVVYQGITYNCVCNCSGQDDCTAVSSGSSSSSGSYGSGSSDYREVIVGAVIQGLFNNLNRWLNSPSEPKAQNQPAQTHEMTDAEKAEMERKQEEYRQKVLEQVTRASDEYNKQVNQNFNTAQEATLTDFKTRLTRSEATKTIKQLNCAAYTSIEAARLACQTDDLSTIGGPLDQARAKADFTSGLPDDCPPIKVSVPDVTPEHPVGFQQYFYNTVRYKSDSVTLRVKALKEADAKMQSETKEKEAVVEKIKTQSQDKNDPQLLRAMKELEEARQKQQQITDEIKTCQKNIDLYDIMRSTFDVDKTSDSKNQDN